MSAIPVKKIALWLIAIFLLYSVFTSPDDAAQMVGSAWDVVVNGFHNVARFFDALIRR